MGSPLANFIDAVKADRDRIQSADEATTKQYLVQRIVHLVGWDIFDELIPEYPVLDGRVDYAVQKAGTNYIFIEVKRVGTDLQNEQAQLLRYAFQEGVKLSVLTNGISWWLYLPLAEGSWEQRRFFAIDLLEQDSRLAAEHFVRFLSCEKVLSGEAVRSAEEYRRSQQRLAILQKTLPLAWNKLVSDPDELLLDMLIETTEALSGYRAEQEMAAKFIKQHLSQLRVPEPRDKSGLTIAKQSKPQIKPQQVLDIASVTGTRPTRFSIGNIAKQIISWKDLLVEVCNLLYQQDPQRFAEVSLSLRGRTRPYFSINPDELRAPEEFRDTGIFFEANQSASSILLRSRSLLALFDYDPDQLHVTLEHP